jgi:hypothetical protein
MTARTKATPSLGIIDALDRLAGQIRKNHPEVPDNIVFVLASGRTGRGAKHGHFAPGSWTENHHEILIAAESLARGPEATLGTLIHELAHAVAASQGIKDTSNNNRYHNKRFKEIAEKMGIELECAPTLGWSLTTLPEATAAKYKAGIEVLGKSLTTYRRGGSEGGTAAPKPRKKTKAPIVCGCEDEVTVSIQWFERHGDALFCSECEQGFTLAA